MRIFGIFLRWCYFIMPEDNKVEFEEIAAEPEEIASAEELGDESAEESGDDYDDEGEEGMSELEDGGMDDGFDLGAVLATEDGDTVCTALLDINESVGSVAHQLSVTNKILVKMLSRLG
mgnify:CR=1 FL=1